MERASSLWYLQFSRSWLWVSASLIISIFTWATARYVLDNSFFISDDYEHFQLAKSLPFVDYLLTPIDVHFVPLHRLFSAILLWMDPLNFRIAIALFMIIQGMAVVMCYLLLERLSPGRWNFFLVLLFACNSAILHVFDWWSAGIHRLPYVLLAIVGLYFYLRFRDERRKIDFFVCSLCTVVALGFYSKAVLIPFYILAIECCLSWRDGFRAWRRYVPGVGLLMLSLIYIGWYLRFSPVHYHEAPPSATLAVDIVITFFRVLINILFLHEVSQWSASEICIFLISGVVILLTCLWRRENLVCWLMLACVLMLNFLIIAVSSRAQLFGGFIALALRYYYEVIFLVSIFLCLILNRAPVAGDAPAWKSRVVGVGLFILCLVYPPLAYNEAKISFGNLSGLSHRKTESYMQSLLTDLDGVSSKSIVLIADGEFPVYVTGEYTKIKKPFSAILPLRYPNVRFVPRDQAQYEIDSQGKLIKF